MRAKLDDRLRPAVSTATTQKGENGRTPWCIIAILSARRAVASRCVMKTTVLARCPSAVRETASTVSNTRFCACASSDAVCCRQPPAAAPRGRERGTHGFVQQDQLDLWSAGAHEGTRDCYALPLGAKKKFSVGRGREGVSG